MANNQFINGQWVDTDTGNVYNMTTGLWSNPSGQQYVNGQWVGANQNSAATNASGSGYSPQAGYGYNLLESEYAQQKYMEDLKAKHGTELQQLQDLSKNAFAKLDADLKSQLAQKNITHEEYMQQRDIAQKESEFARNLAQRQLEFQHSKEMDEAQLKISQAAEMRQERALQASLSANPTDWVAYEFYKRGLNKTGAGAPAGVANAAGGTGSMSPANPTQLDGTPYSAAAGATSDADAQTLAKSLFAGGSNTAPGGWNPKLSGTGVFGTQIEAPNTLTRNEASGMSQTEMGMLAGLLKGGIDMGGGQRVAIDPTEYFQQAQNSWIPTMNEGVDKKMVYS